MAIFEVYHVTRFSRIVKDNKPNALLFAADGLRASTGSRNAFWGFVRVGMRQFASTLTEKPMKGNHVGMVGAAGIEPATLGLEIPS